MGLPGSLCTQIYTAFESFNSKTPTNSVRPPAPTKQTGELSGREPGPAPHASLRPTALGCAVALDACQLGERTRAEEV